MELQLKNIGMIKEANVKIDGLTVVAGENDTGKSTVGKAIFFIAEYSELFLKKTNYKKFIDDKQKYIDEINKLEKEVSSLTDKIDNYDTSSDEDDLSEIFKMANGASSISSQMTKITKKLEKYLAMVSGIEKLEARTDKELEELSIQSQLKTILNKYEEFFTFSLTDESKLILIDEANILGIDNNQVIKKNNTSIITNNPIFIETPLITNLFSFFSKLDTIQNDVSYQLNDYPYTFRSLYKQLKLPLKEKTSIDNDELTKNIDKIIKGSIHINSSGNIVFIRGKVEHNILSVATGIKSFGIIEMLIKNNYITDNTVLILDEPEVHLHPKWQLEMAKIIVKLVKNGVKVVVNSHSPYMIEALKRYSELEPQVEDRTNFYLAEDGYIKEQDSLENIFEKLAMPMRELKKLKMDKYLNE